MGVDRQDKQRILTSSNALEEIIRVIASAKVARPFLVCSGSAERIPGWARFRKENEKMTIFSDFFPNPKYESVEKGVALFRTSQSDGIISIGGGSAIDVAKTIKLFSAMEGNENFLMRPHRHSDLFHVAVPTTAGTGSESTRFSVIYHDGKKYSVEDICMRPDVVILDASLLGTLPDQQKRSTAFDALCQCIESLWAKGAGDESRGYAKQGLKLALSCFEGYLDGDKGMAEGMLMAANLSGRAIDLSKTTAAHAMSYGVSSRFGIAHGHAVALLLPFVWKKILKHPQAQKDQRLSSALDTITECFEVSEREAGVERFVKLFQGSGLPVPCASLEDISELVPQVDLQRLGNTPVDLSAGDLTEIYRCAFGIQ